MQSWLAGALNMPSDKSPVLQRFFFALVHRPTAVLMTSIALLGMSFIATQRIQLDLIPAGISSSDISISATWENANPSEIEQKIIKPLEKELRAISNVSSIYSEADEGSASINISFPGNVDVDQLYAEISDRVERARPMLPAEVDRIRISRRGMSSMPVMFFGIQFPNMERGVAQDLITNILLPRIEAVDGVASATSWGIEPLSIRIWLDEESVFANNINVGALVTRLQGDNLTSPIGDLDAVSGRTIVRVDSRFKSIEDIENFPVRDGFTIKDIGRVEEVRSAPEFMFRFGGEYATSINVSKESSANTFDVCSRLTTLIEDVLPHDPILDRFNFSIYFSQGEMIRESVYSLIKDSLLGGLIACLVLFFFLRNLPYTLLITLSIPFAALIALAYIYFSGGTLNLMSMMGITISIGMLVDNSVVIVESIFKKRESGRGLLESICEGPSEVMLAIVTATLTTVVVFLPLIFFTDNRQQKVIAEAIGMPLIVALLAALLLSIIMVPVAARFIGSSSKSNTAAGHLPAIMTRPLFSAVTWSLKYRFRAFTVYSLILLSGTIATTGRQVASSGDEEGQISVRFSFVDGTSLYDGHLEVLELEKEVLNNEDFKNKFPYVSTGCWFMRNGGSIMIWPDRPLKVKENDALMAYLKENLPERARIDYHFSQEMSRDKDSRPGDWTRIRVSGPDSLIVQDIIKDIRQHASQSDRFQEMSKESDYNQEVLVKLDRERMSRLGVNSQSVLGNIEWTMRGIMVSRFETDSQEIPIIIEYDSSANPDRNSLEEMMIASSNQIVPLSTFAEFTNSRSASTIRRLDGKISDVLGLKSVVKDQKVATEDVQKLMLDVNLPDGYSWKISGGYERTSSDMGDVVSAMILAVGLVFLLMGLLFNSVILPLSALTTIAFAILGANWAFKLSGQPFGTMEMMGMLVLSGVVVNNAIVLIDRILQLERRGQQLNTAIVNAVNDRMRPVFMTALTTVCGLLPIALSEASGSGISFKGMAIGIVGGISVATIFTLTVVPLSFSLFRDFGRLCSSAFASKPLN
ncbi:MAG: efflux RND transporter permease subunit [Planctomycetes bacterium]|nr:efflux RND transporter permease subunit [Planctomycetota bacterium]